MERREDRTGSRGLIGAGLRRAFAWTGDLIVPPVCLGCRASLSAHHALCAACWRDVGFIRAPLCERMGIPLPFDTGGPTVSAAALAEPPDYDRARAAAHFAGTARRLVHGFKYSDRQETRVLLGAWLETAGHDLLGDAHLIVPVPMSRRRLFWRKFNQAAILAHEIGRRSGLPVAVSVLRRRPPPSDAPSRPRQVTRSEPATMIRQRSATSGSLRPSLHPPRELYAERTIPQQRGETAPFVCTTGTSIITNLREVSERLSGKNLSHWNHL